MTSFLLLGPVTRDIIRKEGMSYESAGGPVYYQAGVLSRMGVETTAVVTLSLSDDTLLDSFPEGMQIVPLFRDETMEFENCYPTDDPNQRIQKAFLPINSIKKADLTLLDIENFDAILVSPLSPTDVPLDTFKYIYQFQVPIYLGVQGYLRHLKDDRIILKPWKDLDQFLPLVKMIFMDEVEAGVILGENHFTLEHLAHELSQHGPEEVIITRGDRGSLVYDSKTDSTYQIPADPSPDTIDPTGLGDTYMSAYIARRHEHGDPFESGNFAAKIASLKLQTRGALDQNLNSYR
jgi:sugar/nucleoside kinase (ribokinase family)